MVDKLGHIILNCNVKYRYIIDLFIVPISVIDRINASNETQQLDITLFEFITQSLSERQVINITIVSIWSFGRLGQNQGTRTV